MCVIVPNPDFKALGLQTADYLLSERVQVEPAMNSAIRLVLVIVFLSERFAFIRMTVCLNRQTTFMYADIARILALGLLRSIRLTFQPRF